MVLFRVVEQRREFMRVYEQGKFLNSYISVQEDRSYATRSYNCIMSER